MGTCSTRALLSLAVEARAKRTRASHAKALVLSLALPSRTQAAYLPRFRATEPPNSANNAQCAEFVARGTIPDHVTHMYGPEAVASVQLARAAWLRTAAGESHLWREAPDHVGGRPG